MRLRCRRGGIVDQFDRAGKGCLEIKAHPPLVEIVGLSRDMLV
jgi:translation elongation factor EF-G